MDLNIESIVYTLYFVLKHKIRIDTHLSLFGSGILGLNENKNSDMFVLLVHALILKLIYATIPLFFFFIKNHFNSETLTS